VSKPASFEPSFQSNDLTNAFLKQNKNKSKNKNTNKDNYKERTDSSESESESDSNSDSDSSDPPPAKPNKKVDKRRQPRQRQYPIYPNSKTNCTSPPTQIDAQLGTETTIILAANDGLPEGWMMRVGSGKHYFMRAPDGTEFTSKKVAYDYAKETSKVKGVMEVEVEEEEEEDAESPKSKSRTKSKPTGPSKVSERSERALKKTNKLIHSIRFVWWLAWFARALLKMRLASLGAEEEG